MLSLVHIYFIYKVFKEIKISIFQAVAFNIAFNCIYITYIYIIYKYIYIYTYMFNQILLSPPVK